MPRIRTIKPETPEDEKLGQVSRDARLLYILLWTRCDDHGRFRASPIWLRNNLFPYDTDADVVSWLGELERIDRVRLYTVDGERYGWVPRWETHQRIDNAGKALYPGPDEADSHEPPPVSASRGESRRNSAGRDLDLDLDLDPPLGGSAAGVYEQGFEDAWCDYPRKTAKKDAYKAWKARRREGVASAELHTAAKRYAEHCVRAQTEPKFMLHGSTFFGPNERWKDYLDHGVEARHLRAVGEVSYDVPPEVYT